MENPQEYLALTKYSSRSYKCCIYSEWCEFSIPVSYTHLTLPTT